MKVYGRGRGLGLASLVPVLVILAAVSGCASGPTPEEVAMTQKDQQIQDLTAQVSREREHAMQLEAEKQVVETKLGAMEDENSALKQTNGTLNQLVSEKERMAQLERQRAEEARRKADEASRLAQQSAARPAPAVESTPRAAASEPSGGIKGKYHLRVISLPKNEPNEKAIHEIADHLKKMGIQDVVPRASGKHWVVDVGFFASLRHPEAESLKTKISTMKFQGVRQFESAYFVTY